MRQRKEGGERDKSKERWNTNKVIEVYTMYMYMYLGRLAAALTTPNTTFQLECSACGRDWRTCSTDNVLSTNHTHVHAHCYLCMLHTVAEKTYMYMYKVKGRRPVVL